MNIPGKMANDGLITGYRDERFHFPCAYLGTGKKDKVPPPPKKKDTDSTYDSIRNAPKTAMFDQCPEQVSKDTFAFCQSDLFTVDVC